MLQLFVKLLINYLFTKEIYGSVPAFFLFYSKSICVLCLSFKVYFGGNAIQFESWQVIHVLLSLLGNGD